MVNVREEEEEATAADEASTAAATPTSSLSEPVDLRKTTSAASDRSTCTLGSSGSDPFGPGRARLSQIAGASRSEIEARARSAVLEQQQQQPGTPKGNAWNDDGAQRNGAASPAIGLFSSVAGLFGGGGDDDESAADSEEYGEAANEEAATNATPDESSVQDKDDEEEAPIQEVCTSENDNVAQDASAGVSFDLEQSAAAEDAVCSTSTEEHSDAAAAAAGSGLGGADSATPAKAADDAVLGASRSFAATEPCASFNSAAYDEDWDENEAVGGGGAKKMSQSDTSAKALPVQSACQRHKKRVLATLGMLVLLIGFLGIGIVIGVNLSKGGAVENSSGTAKNPQNGGGGSADIASSRPTLKPASKPTATTSVANEHEGKEVPAPEPTGTPPSAAADDPKEDATASQPTRSPTKKGGSPTKSPPENAGAGTLDMSPTTAGNNSPTAAVAGNASSTIARPTLNSTKVPSTPLDLPAETDDADSEDGGGDDLTYEPGNLQTIKNGILLSKGLDCKIIAKSQKKVKFVDGTFSSDSFHLSPDFGATFPTEGGGWVYLSNSEVDNKKGGVGAIYFNKNAKPIDYKMLLKKTSMNCGGGRTPWGTWISCEEIAKNGQIWEVDPRGLREPKQTVLGGNNTGGRFESFTYDVRNKTDPRFYYTEDRPDGPLRRFRPFNPNWKNPYKMLHGKGEIEYLVLHTTSSDNSTGTYEWTKRKDFAKATALAFFPGSEGIDAFEGYLYFVSKKMKMMYTLDLDGDTWERRSTTHGVFDGSPDQLTRLVGEQEILYFTEGKDAGIHGRDSQGRLFSILESPVYQEETTGLSFSPDHKRLYVAYQKNGILLDIWRKDGLPFSAKTLNIKYHNIDTNIVRS